MPDVAWPASAARSAALAGRFAEDEVKSTRASRIINLQSRILIQIVAVIPDLTDDIRLPFAGREAQASSRARGSGITATRKRGPHCRLIPYRRTSRQRFARAAPAPRAIFEESWTCVARRGTAQHGRNLYRAARLLSTFLSNKQLTKPGVPRQSTYEPSAGRYVLCAIATLRSPFMFSCVRERKLNLTLTLR